MSEPLQILVFLVVLAVVCLSLLVYQRRVNRSTPGWMHDCEIKNRPVWFPRGSACVFCGEEMS